jgi:hypothetical protein
MFPFFIGEFFHRRRRGPRHATDALPVASILDLVVFWVMLVFGAMLVNVALFGAALVMSGAVASNAIAWGTISIAAIVAPLFLWRAMLAWWRMTRK